MLNHQSHCDIISNIVIIVRDERRIDYMLKKEMQECFRELSSENQQYILNLARRIYEIEQQTARLDVNKNCIHHRNMESEEWER